MPNFLKIYRDKIFSPKKSSIQIELKRYFLTGKKINYIFFSLYLARSGVFILMKIKQLIFGKILQGNIINYFLAEKKYRITPYYMLSYQIKSEFPTWVVMGIPSIMRFSNHRECRAKSGQIGSVKGSCDILPGNTPQDLVWVYPLNRASKFHKKPARFDHKFSQPPFLHDIPNISYQFKLELPTSVVMGMPLIMRFSSHRGCRAKSGNIGSVKGSCN